MQLRRLNIYDAEYMLEWVKDPEINSFFRFDADRYTIEDAVSFIEEANRSMDNQKACHYAITECGEEYLGTISLNNTNNSTILKLKKDESVMLLIIRLLYHEKLKELMKLFLWIKVMKTLKMTF